MEKDIEKYCQLFDQYYDKDNVENVLLKLRENGATQLISLIVLKKKLLLPLNDLDHIIVNSKTWLDFKDNTEELRKNIFDGLEEITKDE